MTANDVKATVFEVKGIDGIDPVRVVIIDYELGSGRIMFDCYGMAWSCYWGAMADRTMAQFFEQASTGYLVGKLFCYERNMSKKSRVHEEKYLTRIVDSIKQALLIRRVKP